MFDVLHKNRVSSIRDIIDCIGPIQLGQQAALGTTENSTLIYESLYLGAARSLQQNF